MIIRCCDDEELMLQMLEMAVREAKPDAEIWSYDDQDDLLEDAKEEGCDIAFLDIHMRGMSGVELAKKLIENGEKPTSAAKSAAEMTGYKKNEIYRELV